MEAKCWSGRDLRRDGAVEKESQLGRGGSREQAEGIRVTHIEAYRTKQSCVAWDGLSQAEGRDKGAKCSWLLG
jgi:hypothetical protein